MRISDWSSDVCSSDLIEDESVAGLDAHVFSQVDVPAIPMLAADPRPVVTDLDRASPAIKRSLIAFGLVRIAAVPIHRSEEHTSELQSLMRISYAVFCLKNKNYNFDVNNNIIQ